MPTMKILAAGFTLIELMVVVTVIAILAMLAMPNFQDKIVRDQITEALRLTDLAKGPVATAWTTTATLPADNMNAGLPPPEKIVNNFVSAVTVDAGAIHMTFGNRVNGAIRGKTLSLRPAVMDDLPVVPVVWVCGWANAPDKMSIKGANKTDVAKNFLPRDCR